MPSQLSSSTLFSLFLNITSSIGVIIANKRLVFMEAQFTFSTVLTIIHFIVTFFGCLFFAYGLKLFEPKRLRVRQVIPISLAFCGYVVFNNLSLLTNSVSVYQVSKILCTPLIIAIEALWYGKRERRTTLLSLIPVCFGVSITFYVDSDVNLMGAVWIILAIISNSLYTVWGKAKQLELDAQPMQLLLYQAPISAVILLFVAVPLDGKDALLSYTVTFTTLWTVLLSCLFAFGVNFSFFLFVGRTSPLTMNVVGYLKTSLVFLFGFLFTSVRLSIQSASGVLLTLVGLALYTRSKVGATQLKPAPVSPLLPTLHFHLLPRREHSKVVSV